MDWGVVPTRFIASVISHSTRAIHPPPTSTTAKRLRSASSERTHACGRTASRGLACVAARTQDEHAAGRLWTLAERLEHEIGFRMLAAERNRYERILAPPLTQSDEYRSGVAEAAEIDPDAEATAIAGSVPQP